MDKLTEAIKAQYRRQYDAIQARDKDAQIFYENMFGKIDNDIFMAMREVVFNCYKPIIDDASRSIKILEALRDE